MKTQEIMPVLISVLVIIAIAVLEKQNKTVAALTAAMPLTASLAIWIVYSSSGGERLAMSEITFGLIMGLIPTLGFAVAAWLAARAGMKLVPIMLTGYGAWAVGTVLLLGIRKILEI